MIDLSDAAERAVTKWGGQSQLNQVQEECAELITAISHVRRGRAGAVTELIEETADMIIMMKQLMVILPKDRLEEELAKKLTRLEARLVDES